MFSLLTLVFWAGVAALLYALFDYLRDYSKPQRHTLPIFGQFFKFSSRFPAIHDFHMEEAFYWLEKTGTKTTFSKMPGLRLWTTLDRDCVEHILKTNHSNYLVTPLREVYMGDLLGHGIFNADGANWQLQRKTASHEFSGNRFRTFMMDEFVSHSHLVCRVLDQASREGKPIDVQALFANYTLACTCKIAFGVEVWDPFNEMESKDVSVDTKKFGDAFNFATKRIPNRLLDLHWPILRALNLGKEKEMKAAMDTIRNLIDQVVEMRSKMSREELGKEVDLLSRFMLLKGEVEIPGVTHEVWVKDMVMSFLIAGRDTTSNLLSWMFAILAANKEEEERIHAEILEMMGDEEPTYDGLKEMHQLQSAMYETLRLYPSVPWDPKCCVGDETLPDGTRVRKGDVVIYFPYAMNRMEGEWDRPNDYIPKRWMENGKFKKPDPFAFPVFQAGPRQCLGIEMAQVETKTLVSMILQRFTLTLPKGADFPNYDFDVTLPILGNLMMDVSPRR